MADKFGGIPVESTKDKFGGVAVIDAPAESHPLKDFGGALWEGLGGKTAMDILGGASRNPAKAKTAVDAVKGLVNGILNEGPRILEQLNHAGDAVTRGDWERAAHHLAGAAPFIGGGVQQAGAEAEAGDYAKAAGHTAALLAPAIAPKMPAAARAVADTDAGAAVIGGAKGAGKALIETKPLTIKGIDMQVPTTVASAAAGGQAASMMGLPRTVGTVAGAAAPVIRGAVQGAKSALAERMASAAAKAKEANLTADAAKIPPDVMAELTRESAVEPPVEAPAPAPPEPAPVAPQPTPALRTPVSQPNPTVDHSEIIGRIKQALPPNATTEQIGAVLKAMMEESGTLPPQVQASGEVAPTPSEISPAMQDLPAATRKAAGKSAYRAEKGGDLPQGSGANTIIAANRANKVTTVVEALRAEGTTSATLAKLPASELKARIDALAKANGISDFSPESMEQLMAELKRAEGKPNPPGKPARRAQTKAAKQ